MYKIRGADGKEYGPVSADTLRDWVNQGRANGQTLVLAEGSPEWKPLSSISEFTALFATTTPGTINAPIGTPAGPVKTSAMAIWSLVLGIVGFLCGLTAIAGLILGILSLRDIKASNGRLTGRGMALAGIIISSIVILLFPIAFFAAKLLPALAKAKSKAQAINCVNNVKQLNLAVRIYASDSSDKFPAGTNWCDAILNNAGTPKIYICPGAPNQRSGYAFNAKLSGLEESKIDPSTVMIFESDTGWNASGGKELLITKPRHNARYIIGLADGSVQQVTAAQVAQLRWDPRPQSDSNSNNP